MFVPVIILLLLQFLLNFSNGVTQGGTSAGGGLAFNESTCAPMDPEEIPSEIPDGALPLCAGDFDKFYELIAYRDQLCFFPSTFNSNPPNNVVCYNGHKPSGDLFLFPPVYLGRDDSQEILMQISGIDQSYYVYNMLVGRFQFTRKEVKADPGAAFVIPHSYFIVPNFLMDMSDVLHGKEDKAVKPYETLKSILTPEMYANVRQSCGSPYLKCVLDVTNVTESPSSGQLLNVPFLIEEPTAVQHEQKMTILRICNTSNLVRPCTYVIKDYVSQKYFYVPWNLPTYKNTNIWTDECSPVAKIPILRSMTDQFKERREQLKPDLQPFPPF